MKPRHVLLVLAVAFALMSAALVYAQDDATLPTGDQYRARYDGIAFARTDDGGFILGDPDAPITFVEFADFLCPFCITYQEVAHTLIEEYVRTGQARFEYRLFPIVDPTYSVYTSQLVECADNQQAGLFWPAHDLLYDLARLRQIGPDTSQRLAETFDLDQAELVACAETAEQFQTDLVVGQAVGVNGTPAIRARVANGDIGIIFLNGQAFTRGGLPFELLALIIGEGDYESSVVVPRPLLSDLVTESDCFSPCWRGLIIGETSWDDAVAALGSDPQFVDFQTVDDPNSSTRLAGWRGLASATNDYSQAASLTGETIDIVVLIDYTDLPIGDALAIQGEPDYAGATPFNAQGVSVVDLVYAEKSMILRVLALADEGGFNPGSALVSVQYVAPALMADFIANATDAVVWVGFDGFESYIYTD